MQRTPSLVGIEALKVAGSFVNKAFESGRNNRGPMVDRFQEADDLPGVGYAWCAAFVTYCIEKVLKKDAPVIGEASVARWLAWGRQNHLVVDRPFRGDLVTFQFSSGDAVDHIGFVEKVLALGPMLRIQTIEGNTGPSGAVSDPGTGKDGVYRKVRYVRRGSVRFVRIPDSFLPKPIKRRCKCCGRLL